MSEIQKIKMMFSFLAQAATARSSHGYAACPPWYFTEGLRCTKELKSVPWYKQRRWIYEMKHNPEFYEKAKQYLPKSKSTKNTTTTSEVEKNPCYSACPPWMEICTLQCMAEPWYQQEEWVKKMEEDPEFKAKALKYIPMPISETEEVEENRRVGKCYASCPPFWDGPCDKMCHDVPWYQQERWVEMMKEDPEFKAKALPYITEQNSARKANKQRPCYSACPPWIRGCTMQCMAEPWYKQKEWVKKMEEDPEFKAKAQKYLKKHSI